MNWGNIITIIGSILGTLGGWESIKYLLNRKTNARILDAQAGSEEFRVLRDTNDFLQQQLKLKEERFAEQTQVVRKQNTEILELTKAKAVVELELQKYKCIVAKCPNRQPQNGY